MQLTNNVQKRIMLGLATSLLISCGGSGNDNKKDPDGELPASQVIEVSGKASKGIIKQGIVSIYKLNSDGSLGEQITTLPTEVLTTEKGAYTAELAEDYEGAIKIIITPGANSVMVCDVVEGCGETPFGGDLALDSHFTLSAVAKAVKGDEDKTQVTTNVTPLTNIAASLFEETLASGTGVDLQDAVTAANNQVAELFNLGTGVDVSAIEIIDVTNQDDLANADSQTFQAAAISAAIAARAVQSNDLSNFLTLSAQEIAANKGTIRVSAANDNENIISLEDTLDEVKNLNSQLQSRILEKIQNSDLSDTDKAAAEQALQDALQNNSNISSAITDIILEAENDIEAAAGETRSGDEFDVDDITGQPAGPSVSGKLIADERSLSEDGEISIDVLANDTLSIQGGTNEQIELISVSSPANGSAEIIDGKITYTPNPDFEGEDEFTYTVNALELTFTAVVKLTVTAQSDLTGGSFTLAEDESRTEPAIGSLAADSIDNIEIISAPANGTAQVEANNIKYTPYPDYFGTDQLTYRVNLKSGSSEEAVFDYTITPVADAIDDSLNTDQFVDLNANLLSNDKFSGQIQSVKLLDGDNPVDELITPKAKASITSDGSFIYQPIDHAVGTDSLSYQVTTDSGIVENAIVTVEINANEPTAKAILMVEDMRTWGAYLFPDDFEAAGTLVEDTQAMLDVVELAGPVFENGLANTSLLGDAFAVVEQILDEIDSGVTDETVFEAADYDQSLSGQITVQELIDTQALIQLDLTREGDSLSLDAEFNIPAEESEDSDLVEKLVSAKINQGSLNAGNLSVMFKADSAIEVTLAGMAHPDEVQNEVLEIHFDAGVILEQQAEAELNETVKFDGALVFSLVKGQDFNVNIINTDDNTTETDTLELYLPTDVSARGEFTTNDINTFAVDIALSIANAAEHVLPGPVEIEDSSNALSLSFDLEDENNWLNANLQVSFDANPKVESQGTVRVEVQRTGYEVAEIRLTMSDSNSELTLMHITDSQDLVEIANNDGLLLTYNEQGISEANGKTILAEIRTTDEAKTLLATFEQTQDGMVEVHYTGTSRFETFY